MLEKERQIAIQRAERLFQTNSESTTLDRTPRSLLHHNKNIQTQHSFIKKLIYFSDLKISPVVVYIFCIVFSVLLGWGSSMVISYYFVPIYLVGGAFIPIASLRARSDRRAKEFATDYPTVLLAMASSLKVGMTPLQALERATKLLSEKSVVKNEIRLLIENLSKGMPRQQAIETFAASIDLPDLDLFRSAFLLVLENGGRFAPTLDRLAAVSRDRTTLIKSAFVTTATMRMTANFLLTVAPFLLIVVSMRSDSFWTLLLEHPTANFIGSAGIVLITVSYLALRTMSNFKP